MRMSNEIAMGVTILFDLTPTAIACCNVIVSAASAFEEV